LRSKNYRVLRFWNSDFVGNIEGVLQIIEAELLAGQPLTPTLSP
jgi:very-short-patch-repair endonuclease